MPNSIKNACHWLMESWAGATWHDYAFSACWVVLIGYLIAKFSTPPTG